jgi:hypothetical protein
MSKSNPFPVRLDDREAKAVKAEQVRLSEEGQRGTKSNAIRSLIMRASTLNDKPAPNGYYREAES